jgi:hypothetical protein
MDQNILFQLLNTLYSELNDLKIVYLSESYTLWEFADKFQFHNEPSRPLFEDNPQNNKGKKAFATCEKIETLLNKICTPTNIFLMVYLFLFDNTLGNSDYVFYYFIILGTCGTRIQM